MNFKWGDWENLKQDSNSPYTDWWQRHQQNYSGPEELLEEFGEIGLGFFQSQAENGIFNSRDEFKMFPELRDAPLRKSSRCQDQAYPKFEKSVGRDLANKSVIMAFIDDGIGFANERFLLREPANNGQKQKFTYKSRLKYLWNQNADCIGIDQSSAVKFGREWQPSAIEKIFSDNVDASAFPNEAAIYREMQMTNVLKSTASHGTHVMDLCTGYNYENAEASKRPIIAVQLPRLATADTSGAFLGVYVSRAIAYIIDRAANINSDRKKKLPLVINFSYGFHAGPHDGFGELERWIDATVKKATIGSGKEKERLISFVVPSGNSFLARSHAKFEFVKSGAKQQTNWFIPATSKSPNFLEIWYENEIADATPNFSFEITPPLAKIPLKELVIDTPGKRFRPLYNGANQLIGGVYTENPHRLQDETNFLPSRQRVTFVITKTDTDFIPRAIHPCGFSCCLCKLFRRSFGSLHSSENKTNPTLRELSDQPEPLAPHGSWKISMADGGAQSSELSTRADLWIQRNDTPTGFDPVGRQSFFEDNDYQEFDEMGRPCESDSTGPESKIKREGTLNAFATGAISIRVGGYLRHYEYAAGPAGYTSSGDSTVAKPLRDTQLIEVSSPVSENNAIRGLCAAGTWSGSTVGIGGTSIAAPQAARWIAKHLESQTHVTVGKLPVPFDGSREHIRILASTLPNQLPPGSSRVLNKYREGHGHLEYLD